MRVAPGVQLWARLSVGSADFSASRAPIPVHRATRRQQRVAAHGRSGADLDRRRPAAFVGGNLPVTMRRRRAVRIHRAVRGRVGQSGSGAPEPDVGRAGAADSAGMTVMSLSRLGDWGGVWTGVARIDSPGLHRLRIADAESNPILCEVQSGGERIVWRTCTAANATSAAARATTSTATSPTPATLLLGLRLAPGERRVREATRLELHAPRNGGAPPARPVRGVSGMRVDNALRERQRPQRVLPA